MRRSSGKVGSGGAKLAKHNFDGKGMHSCKLGLFRCGGCKMGNNITLSLLFVIITSLSPQKSEISPLWMLNWISGRMRSVG